MAKLEIYNKDVLIFGVSFKYPKKKIRNSFKANCNFSEKAIKTKLELLKEKINKSSLFSKNYEIFLTVQSKMNDKDFNEEDNG